MLLVAPSFTTPTMDKNCLNFEARDVGRYLDVMVGQGSPTCSLTTSPVALEQKTKLLLTTQIPNFVDLFQNLMYALG